MIKDTLKDAESRIASCRGSSQRGLDVRADRACEPGPGRKIARGILRVHAGLSELSVKKGRVKVTPYDVLVDYDLFIRDGSVPGGNYAEIWTQLFQIISQQPMLLQKFDITRIFKHIS